MISLPWDRLDVLGFEAMRVVLSVLWQSSVLLGAAGLLVFALRRRSAAIRHRVWTAALLLTPLIPVLTWLGSQTGSPQLHIPIIPTFETASVQPPQSPATGEITVTNEKETGASRAAGSTRGSGQGDPESLQTAAATKLSIPQTNTPVRGPRSAHPWAIASITYTCGLVLLVGLVSLGRLRLRRYTREGRIVTNPRVTDVFETARKQVGLERGCVLVEIDNLHAPLTYRTFHPVIALPYGFTDELSDAELRTIALHELAHIKRNDPLVLNLASIIRAVFFFHPLVWLAAREIATLAEEAADNVVIEATEAPLPYARMLTRLTEQLTHRLFQTELAVGIVFSKSALLRRIEAILSPRADQLRHLSFGVLAMTITLVLSSLVLATAVPLTHVSFTATAGDDHAKGMSLRHIWEVNRFSSVYPAGVSRDGRYVSYVDWRGGNLAIRDLESGTNRMITENTTWASTGGWNQESVISPDGKRIAYHWFVEKDGEDIYTLRVIDMDGSNDRAVIHDKATPWVRPLDWSPDGENLLVHITYGDFRMRPNIRIEMAIVSVDDGSVTALKEWKGRRWPQMASFSPDGKYVAFDQSPTAGAEPRDIFIVELKSGREIAVVEHSANDEYLGWTPDGKAVLFASDRTSMRSLWMLEISNGDPVGSPIMLKSDFAGDPIGFGSDGSYYFGKQTMSRDVFVATLGESGTDFQTIPQNATSLFVHSASSSDWSPDGQSLAFKARSQTGTENSVFVIYSAETGAERIVQPSPRLKFGPQGRQGPVQWSPDGQALYVCASSLTGERGIYRVDVATGNARLIVKHFKPRNPLPTPDGKAIYFLQRWGPLIRHDLATGQEEEIYRSTEQIQGLDLSPDGKSLVFYHDGASIVVISADGGEPREVVHLDESEQTEFALRFVTWTPDGNHLLFGKRNNELWRVHIDTGNQEQLGSEIPGLFHAKLHPDGRRIAYTTIEHGSELWVMENFLPDLDKSP